MKNRKLIGSWVPFYMKWTGITMYFAVGLILMSAFGCARKPIEGTAIYMLSGDTVSGPAWLTGDCATFWDGKMKKRICAVGSNKSGTNVEELRMHAIEDAEDKIGGELKARVQAVIEYFGKSRKGHKEFGHPANLDLMRKTSQRISEDAVKFAQVNDFWITSTNEVYTLVSIDQTAFNDAVGRMNYISEDLRQELYKHSKSIMEQAEQDLRKELEEKAKKLLN